MSLPETEVLNNLVSRVFRIEDVTSEDPRKGFFLRYRGRGQFGPSDSEPKPARRPGINDPGGAVV